MKNALGLTPIIRTALVVNDLDAAVEFYAAVLEMVVVRHGPVEDATVFRQLGLPPGQARFAVLKSDDAAPEVGMLSFLEVTEPAPQALPSPGPAIRTGEAILVLHAVDVQKIQSRLISCSADIMCPLIDFTHPSGSVQREITFRDPNGVAVCVIERRVTSADP